MAPRKQQPKKQPPAADADAIRKRLVRTASELAKLRSACDYCHPDLDPFSALIERRA